MKRTRQKQLLLSGGILKSGIGGYCKDFRLILSFHSLQSRFGIIRKPQYKGTDAYHGTELKIPTGEEMLLRLVEEFSTISIPQFIHPGIHILKGSILQ